MENMICIRLRMKVFLYLWSVTADNEETQKKGVILVCWPRISESKQKNSRFRQTQPYSGGINSWEPFPFESVPFTFVEAMRSHF